MAMVLHNNIRPESPHMEAFLISTGVVALAEMGDKTQLLALVLAARNEEQLQQVAEACTALGARGLSRAVLCGELLAAQLHGEPLPLEARLAQLLSTDRL